MREERERERGRGERREEKTEEEYSLVFIVNLIFLTVLYFSNLETHQILTAINFVEQR